MKQKGKRTPTVHLEMLHDQKKGTYEQYQKRTRFTRSL